MRKTFFLIAVLMMSLVSSAQTKRGDFTYDGKVDINDLSCLIGYLMGSSWDQTSVTRDTVTVNGESIVMIFVEGCQLPQTDPYVTITIPDFWIAQTEVTQKLWKTVMGSNPGTDNWDERKPVNMVSWNDCQEFIAKLNSLTGKQFRLPSSYEWEHAARGGTLSQGYLYSGGDDLDVVGWYKHNASGGHHHPVMMLGCNELGLYDMSGNVMEWTSTMNGETQAFLYGGCWKYIASMCTPGSKQSYPLTMKNELHGLRLAATTMEPASE